MPLWRGGPRMVPDDESYSFPGDVKYRKVIVEWNSPASGMVRRPRASRWSICRNNPRCESGWRQQDEECSALGTYSKLLRYAYRELFPEQLSAENYHVFGEAPPFA